MDRKSCNAVLSLSAVMMGALTFGFGAVPGAQAAPKVTAVVEEPERGSYSVNIFNANATEAASCMGAWSEGQYYYGAVLKYRGDLRKKIDYKWSSGFECSFTPEPGTLEIIRDGAAQRTKGELVCTLRSEGYLFDALGHMTIYRTQNQWGLQALLDVKGIGNAKNCNFTQHFSGVRIGN